MNPAPERSAGLPRVLGPWMGCAIVVGTIIGSGVFKKPAAVADVVPFTGVVALVWITAGLLTLLGALAYAEVAVLLPRAGGNYVFLREGYGRLAGFLWGWVDFCIIRSASLAALATIFTESLADLLSAGVVLPLWARYTLTVSVLLGLGAVNIRGVRWGGGLQVVVTAVKAGSLAAIVVLPFLIWVAYPGGPVSADHLRPVWPEESAREGLETQMDRALAEKVQKGELDEEQRSSALAEFKTHTSLTLSALGSALLAVLWPYHGWQNIAPVAGEIRQPQRNIPLSLLTGVGIVVALYLGANLAYALVIPQGEMATLKTVPVVTVFGRQLLGPLGAALASAAVMISVFGALNGNLIVGPRLLYAMSADGLAPRALSGVHAQYQTPAAAIAVLAGWACLQVVVVALLTHVGWLHPGKSHFDRLTDFAMFGAVIFETMAVLSIFVFRRKYPDAERPYRCWGYPVVPALYVVVPAFILVNFFVAQTAEAVAGVSFIALGATVYFLLGLQRTGPPTTVSEAPGEVR
jgi:APA family basic amino acid/polyamine antiporter